MLNVQKEYSKIRQAFSSTGFIMKCWTDTLINKLSKLFADQTLRFIFKDYISSGNVYKMIESDSTLSKNMEEYENTVEIFEQSFKASKYVLLRNKSLRPKKIK